MHYKHYLILLTTFNSIRIFYSSKILFFDLKNRSSQIKK